MIVYYHPKFSRMYKKLPGTLQKLAEERERMFRANHFDRRLDTHKLHGRLKEFWSFEIDTKNHIMFEFLGADVIFLKIGDHSTY